jgi:hypothetical protein
VLLLYLSYLQSFRWQAGNGSNKDKRQKIKVKSEAKQTRMGKKTTMKQLIGY